MAKKALNKWTAPKSIAPEKIIQFGEGNFLRAFVDWIVWNMNAKTNFNAGVIAEGEPMEKVAKRFAEYVIEVANGAKTNNEKNGYHEISIFKNGVTL